MKNTEIEVLLRTLNEKYPIENVKTIYAGFFQDTLGNLEKEAIAALLVEFWKRKRRITAIEFDELLEMIYQDAGKYAAFTRDKIVTDREIKEKIKDGTLPFNPLFRPMIFPLIFPSLFANIVEFTDEKLGEMVEDELVIFTSSTSFVPTDKLLQPIFEKYSL